ncbi:gliding motility-associated C-terminal domain-containing protein [Kaistella sp. DKR-2]|uniref:T9SS type B sorting domain-containing protein n=1 Tax=Kaistella soli TaxID=2849654 RepID=UPI001C25A703|nr:T9SS type B sorting domain-containing protein [Kaistella soli]MBU8883135.1 gliding motility-associated C-terminal domain-containing protein [Kaistella soli]
MKKLLFFLFAFVSTISYAQLDREHWFGPLVDRVNSFGSVNSDYQSIYMSTGETTPFKVEVYFNNAVVATYTLSKNNPQKHTVSTADRKKIIINPGWVPDPAAGLFQPVTMGFYLKGEKPFFASMRFSIFNHAEIITSKGTAALGTEFRVATAPLVSATGTLNFMNSVMATENNTTVTVSDFQPDVIFMDEIPRTQITFTLNKGQSYIIEGSDSYYENQTGYIGAKIISDKPVVVTNGNFNGQYAQNIGSSDILMDQAVPINKLGKTFVLVKGNGQNSYTFGNLTTMEKAIIVAVKNNTKIYLNADPVPVANLQEGEFFTTPPNSYVDQGSGHFNMYISSSEDIYVYQLLAGSVGHVSNPNGEATGGFNYIPPLSCYLPRKIDEIGLIDENFFKSNSNLNGILNIPTKLNVITEKGAIIDIKRNGVSLPISSANGPYNVSGNSDWQTYSFPNISGNISVASSKAVTAGISAGDDAVGYGGFFAGFSATPLITKVEGECLPDDVKIAVTEGFSNYQWLQKVGNTYINAPISPRNPSNTDYFYYPSQAGIYAVKIQQGSCPEIQTEDFNFFNCTNYTNYNYTICSDLKITPKFALSTQTVNPSSVNVTMPSTKGTVSIAADGSINYSANKNASGTDTFRFAFCGVGSIPDCEVIQATVKLNQVISHDVVLKACSLTNNAIFNLTEAIVTPDTAAQKQYYSDSALQNLIPNNLLANYPAANGDLVYVHLKNSFGCEATSVISLETNLPPAVNENLYTKTHCDEDIDGIIDGKYKVNLNSITPIVVPNSSGLTVRYYENEAKANIGGTDNITGIYTFVAGNTQIWIRADATNVCPPAIRKIVLNIGTKLSINNTVSDFACDNDLDNKTNINLASYIRLFTADSSITAKYFDELTKAQNNLAGENLPADQIITGNTIFYYRLKKQGFCEAIGTLNLTLRQPKKSLVLTDQKICPGTKVTLDAGPGFTAYLWSTGKTTSSISAPVGNYWVDLSFNGCVYRHEVSVTAVSLPEIVSVEIQGSTVTVSVTGGNPPYQYAIDGGNYQTSNVFTNVPGGDHTVYVISSDHCAPVSADINVIQLYNAITPNGDGFNDVLDYSGLLKKNEPFLQIFDRYGKTVFIGDKNNRFTWDGKSSGKIIETGSYWYVMHWKEPGFETVSKFTGWVLVKNRE